MHKQANTKPFGWLLLIIAFSSTFYALFFMPKTTHTNSVFFESLCPEQEAVVMTSFLLLVLGLFCLVAPKKRL